ncbi:MAG: hypothetical protein K0U61_02535 [Alphaproteobacteria bacterium]|nr:hypothetical protein [Alphaproteobacteria bacterium]
MDSVESQFLEARKRKRPRDTLVEHTTETRVDLAQGDRERIDQLEREIEDLKECLFQTLETVKGFCPQVLNMMAIAMQIEERQRRIEASSDTLAESIKIMGRGVVRRDVA